MTQPLSRRAFLQMTGVLTLTTAVLPSLSQVFASARQHGEYGRLLRPVVSPNRRVRLLPHTVVTLTEAGIAEYSWLKPTDIQTMPEFQPNIPIMVPSEYPQLMQVVVPNAVLHQRCDVLAPVLSTAGYGSGAWAVDFLPESDFGSAGWLHLCDDAGRMLGWSQASHWRIVDASPAEMQFDRIRIDRQMQTMTLYQGYEAAVSWAVSTSDSAWTGQSTAVEWSVRAHEHDRPLSWAIRLINGIMIGGADWHNEFGAPHDTAHVELHPYLAKWLYQHLAEKAAIDIV